MDYRRIIADLLKKEVVVDESLIEVPPDPKLGDFALPCFPFAKTLRKNPVQIASELAAKLKPNQYIREIKANGPYLNFFVNKQALAADVLKKILDKKDRFGSSDAGKGKNAIVEHTSLNPNSSPHVGRARNALIGDSAVRLLRFQGYHAEVHYFVNDIGKQIAMLVLGCGDRKVTFEQLLDIYVDINKKVESDDKLQAKVFQLLNKLEKGDKNVISQFKRIVKICVDGQRRILSELGIKYDYFDYESDYLFGKKTEEVLKLLQKTGKLFKDDTGRWVLDESGYGLDMKAPVFVLTRSDGTSLYSLRDIAYTIDKIKKGKDRNIIVLGEEQKLYFQQLSVALNLLGYRPPDVVHYSFVLVAGGGRMETRSGNVVLLQDFMKEAVEKSKAEILKRNPKINPKDLEKLSRIIGYGALKFSILKISPDKNVTFDWEQALNFEGETGPYIQYAFARINSIFNKYNKKINYKNIDYSLLKTEQEQKLITVLSNFENILSEATKNLRPHLIATYLLELSQTFNEFYQFCPIIKEEESLRNARLALIGSVRTVLKTGLSLLGIDAPDRM